MAAEIRQRHEIHAGAFRRTESVFEDFLAVRPGDRMHGIEAEGEARLDQRADRVEIEQLFHQRGIIGNRVDDFHIHVAKLLGADRIDVGIRGLGDHILRNCLGAGEDCLGDFFRRRPAIAYIVLDAEIFGRAAGIVAGGQDETAESLVLADDVGSGGRRQNAALADEDTAKAVGRRHLDGDLHHLAIVVAAVTADHQGLAC